MRTTGARCPECGIESDLSQIYTGRTSRIKPWLGLLFWTCMFGLIPLSFFTLGIRCAQVIGILVMLGYGTYLVRRS